MSASLMDEASGRMEIDSSFDAAKLEAFVYQALAATDDDAIAPTERIDMLAELATELQRRPKTPAHLEAAITLYDRALSLCPSDDVLTEARLKTRRAGVLLAMPGRDGDLLEEACRLLADALTALKELAEPEEVAEVEMNHGLALQELAASGRARMPDAVAAYHRALTIFDAKRFPVEFAIIQNNLATAFLSMPLSDERGRIREALAVQCFEQALKAVTLVDHPREYAMLQNNLGNALQHASSGHVIENRLRAIDAYDEALKVRTRATTPLEYANTVANKATCLASLPDDLACPEAGNRTNISKALALYEEAQEIFSDRGETDKARLVAEAISELRQELT
jgi:tetratricopeptide (TPR) repeat protein